MICRNMNFQFTTLTTFLAFLYDFVLTQNDVRRPPSIIFNPEVTKVTFELGSIFILFCHAEGTPEVTYAWKKNGEFLNIDISTIIQFDNIPQTVSAIEADNGFYQCFASNQYGTALSTVSRVELPIIGIRLFNNPVNNMIVAEGRPFVMPAARLGSLQGQQHGWEFDASDDDGYPRQLDQSRRLQFAFNGDLYFVYAVKEDEIGGKLYTSTVNARYTYFDAIVSKSTVNNNYTLLSITNFTNIFHGTTNTRITVTNDSESLLEFLPNITYSSKSQDIALIGRSIKLKCFFSGKPLPNITWSRPGNRNLPSGRNHLSYFGTELTISNIRESDEGEYVCTATNPVGATRHSLNFSVGAVPMFNRDGLRNINMTEGETITFNCSAIAKPIAAIVWFRNGQPIDAENPPKRFAFSSGKTSLTIRDVCRDCDDRETKTDLMVIQCNASNVHGYAFAQGYLNVLLKTNVTIIGSENVSVDFLGETRLMFQCVATSDPSTTPTILWYKTEPYGNLVRNEPPYIFVTKDFLILTFYLNCSVCAKYLGEYKCIGDNGYSRDVRTITISYDFRPSTGAATQNKEEQLAVGKILLGSGAVGVVLFLIGLYLCLKLRVDISTKQSKNRKLPKQPEMCDSVENRTGSIIDYERSLPRPTSMYDEIGYDTINQLMEEIENIGGVMPRSVNCTPVHVYSRHEWIDVPDREVEGTGWSMLDKETKYDDMGFSIAMEDITNRERMKTNQDPGYEAVCIEAGGVPNLNTQYEAINTYTDLKRKEVNSGLNLGQTDVYPHLELGSKEINPSSDMIGKYVDLYTNMGKEDADENLHMTSDPTAQTIACEVDYLVLEN